MSTRILNAQGIISSDVPTGNLLWVDAVNGVDALAVRGRLTIPFRTLTAAKGAAQVGDTIMVLPGTYNEKNLLKNEVNWHFFPGTIVQWSTASSGAIFDTSTNGTGAAVRSVITGFGQFGMGVADGTNHIIHSAVSGSDLSIEARSLGSGDPCIKVGSAVVSGTLTVRVHGTISAGASSAILISGGSLTDSRIEAAKVFSSGGSALHVTGGGLQLVAGRLESSTVPCVEIAGGNGITNIRAAEIYCPAYYAVRYSTTNGAKLDIVNARIRSDGALSTAPALNIDANIGTNNRYIKLTGCVLLVGSGASVSIAAATADTKVVVHGAFLANQNVSANVTLEGHGASIIHASV